MFRIRRIFDDLLPVNQAAIAEVRKIFSEHFSGAPRKDIDELPFRLRDPLTHQFRTILYVAEKGSHIVGFALALFEPVLRFCYLDYLAAGSWMSGRGVGAALYERVRDEAVGLEAKGLFFECLPDDPEACPDPVLRKQNAARLKFYEHYGARPIAGSDYEAPIDGLTNTTGMPHLVFDGLDLHRPLRPKYVKQVVQAILERKYGQLCPPEYVRQVVNSFHDDPVRLRDFRYVRKEPEHKPAAARPNELIALTINDKHDIHHIRERGYVEAPVRISAIRGPLIATGLMEPVPVHEFGLDHILAVHDRDFVNYLRRACESTKPGQSVYPYVFPIRNKARQPRELAIRAGYYCIDTFTPINANAYPAARRAVDCALTAADEVLRGRRLAYALVRPPGHHAERRAYGGFCYFNNAAVAAHYLSRQGRVAIVDVDYHHGNGQQDIFYSRSDVLTISIHGNPDFAYPYFTGFADERGEGPGEGFNINIPLAEVRSGEQYRQALQRALVAVRKFRPQFLLIALGLDPAKGDPTGTWLLTAKDFEQNGRMLGQLGLPTVVVQEGGYRTRTLGTNAAHFFQGLFQGAYGFAANGHDRIHDHKPAPPPPAVVAEIGPPTPSV